MSISIHVSTSKVTPGLWYDRAMINNVAQDRHNYKNPDILRLSEVCCTLSMCVRVWLSISRAYRVCVLVGNGRWPVGVRQRRRARPHHHGHCLVRLRKDHVLVELGRICKGSEAVETSDRCPRRAVRVLHVRCRTEIRHYRQRMCMLCGDRSDVTTHVLQDHRPSGCSRVAAAINCV